MPTLANLLEEHKNNKKDKKVFGLVFPGGGMRGAYSAGAMVPLIEMGLTDAFEHVIGASAGAINGAYFVDEYAETLDAYIDELSNKEFINLLRRDKKIDIDYAVDKVIHANHPFNLRRMAGAHAQLHIIATDAKTGKKAVLSGPEQLKDIYEGLRASAALPIMYDKLVMVGGRYYIDGSVADSIPVDVAIKLGCTDIIVVLTERLEYYRNDAKDDRLIKHLIRKFAKNQPQAVRKVLPTNEKLLRINLRYITKPHKKVRIYVLEPSDEKETISPATIDRPKIEAFARLGIADMKTFLQKPLS